MEVITKRFINALALVYNAKAYTKRKKTTKSVENVSSFESNCWNGFKSVISGRQHMYNGF